MKIKKLFLSKRQISIGNTNFNFNCISLYQSKLMVIIVEKTSIINVEDNMNTTLEIISYFIVSLLAAAALINIMGIIIKIRGQKTIDGKELVDRGAKIVKTHDGRKVEYICYGSESADVPVIINIHGSNMEAVFQKVIHQAACRDLKVKGISISLPGYGNTDMKVGRVVVDWPKEDLAAVLDAERINNFYITGHSQGNPHAMAAAFIYPDRVKGLGLNAPLLPVDLTKDLNLTGALGADSLPFTKTLKKWYMGWYFSLLYITTGTLSPDLLMLGLCRQIPELKKQGTLYERIKYSFGRAVIRNALGNCWESAKDVCYLWGFDPRELKTKNVCVWHASDDSMCPPDNGRWLANFFREIEGSVVDFRDDDISLNHFTFCQGKYLESKYSMLKKLLDQEKELNG